MPEEPIFPGGTSVSHLRVYDWPAPDAPGGSGSPHFHTTSTEAYVVLGGRGRVETLGADGFASHELTPGRIVWFSPGVIHRAVNDGGLEVLVVMSNAGLPESGDAVLTFPPEILASAEAYREAVTLPSPGAVPDDRESGSARTDPEGDMREDVVVAHAARTRRDLALEGYARLRAAVESEGPEALRPLYGAATLLVAGRAAAWRDLWTTTVARAASDTDRALALLSSGALSNGKAEPRTGSVNTETEPLDAVGHLMRGAVAASDPRPGPRRYGMCGRLRT